MEAKLVTLKNAKLLKELGFDEWCRYCYGVAVKHNDVCIDEDEEYELKAEGRGDEIKYVDGGMLYNMNFQNSMYDGKTYACPSQEFALQWVRKNYKIHIHSIPYITVEGQLWLAEAIMYNDESWQKIDGLTTMVCKTPETAIEKTLTKTLNYIKKQLKI